MNGITDINVNYSTFGGRLKKARRDKGLTQNGLSEKIGICRDTLVKWERDAASPDLKLVVELCKILDCDIGYFVGEYDTKKRVSDDLCSLTGLSEQAAKTLLNTRKRELIYIEKLLTNPTALFDISENFCQYIMARFNVENPIGIEHLEMIKTMFNSEVADEIKEWMIQAAFNKEAQRDAFFMKYQNACVNFLLSPEKEETR